MPCQYMTATDCDSGLWTSTWMRWKRICAHAFRHVCTCAKTGPSGARTPPVASRQSTGSTEHMLAALLDEAARRKVRGRVCRGLVLPSPTSRETFREWLLLRVRSRSPNLPSGPLLNRLLMNRAANRQSGCLMAKIDSICACLNRPKKDLFPA